MKVALQVFEEFCTFHIAAVACAGEVERLHVQVIMLAHGLTTHAFCDDLSK